MKINFQTTTIKNKIYPKFKKTNIIHFQAMKCSEKNFEIKKIQDLHCPICGLLMLNDNEQKAFIDDVTNKRGQNLKDALEKYEDESVFIRNQENNRKKTIYRPQKQQVVNILKDLALAYPTLSIAELVRIKSEECLKRLIDKQFVVINELENYINTSEISQEEKEAFFRVLNEYKNRVLGKSETRFKRKSFIHDIQTPIKDPAIKQEITKIASKIPTSDTEVDAFFVKYSDSKRSDREIASKLVKQTTPSAEHLIPKSKQGPNKTNNYICDCEDCNSSRGNILFDEWIKDKKDIQKGLQEYLEEVQKALDFGKLNPKYDSYIDEIIETISQISHGKIKLSAPKTYNDDKRKTILEKRRNEINKVNLEMIRLIERIRTLRQEIAQLKENPQFENISQYSITQTNIKKLKEKEAELRRELEIAQKEKEASMNTIADINRLEQKAKKENSEELEAQIQDFDRSGESLKLEQSNNKIIKLKIELNDIENQISNLTNKLSTLKKLISEDKTKTSLEALETTIGQLESLTKQINTIKNSIFDEKILKERLKSIEKERKELENENVAILQTNKINPKNNTEYLKYCHFEELYEAASKISEYHSLRNGEISPHNASEIADIAQKEIRKKVIKLSQRNDVRYFMNLARISENQEEEAIIRIRLEEIKQITPELEKLNLEYAKISQNRSLDEIKSLYESLKSQQTLEQKILNISELTSELQNLQDTLSYNQKILGKLRVKYRALSNEEYRKLMSLIYC